MKQKVVAYVFLVLLLVSLIPIFSLSVISSPGYGNSSFTKMDYWDTSGSTSSVSVSATSWQSMPFTVGYSNGNANYNMSNISLNVYLSDPGTVNVTMMLRATSGGVPTGANLTYVSKDITFIAGTPIKWVMFNLSARRKVFAGEVYAICLKEKYGSSFSPSFIIDANTGYNGGTRYVSSDSGVTWSATSYDIFFRVNGSYIFNATTNAATEITDTSATLNGVSYGASGMTCGFWYNYSGSAKTNVTCTGTYNNGIVFSKTVSSLLAAKKYTFRAWTLKTGMGYFNSSTTQVFLTKPNAPHGATTTLYKNNITLNWHNCSTGAFTNTTVVRYSTTGYPTTPYVGILVYNGTKNTTALVIDWTPATTYYFSLWTFLIKDGLSCYSSTYNKTSNLTESYPLSLTVIGYTDTVINLSWTPSVNDNVLVRKLGSSPLNPSDGTELVNASGVHTYNDSGLTPNKHYYYKAWDFDATSLKNTSTDHWTKPSIPTSVTNQTYGSGTTLYLKISWVKGTGANRTAVRRSTISQPLLITDGTSVYNGTGTYVNMSITTAAYYTVFSYSNLSGYSSPGVNVSWFVFWLNCYNESSGAALTNWDIFITNLTGTQTYQKTNCNNSLLISTGSMPKGACTIQFSRANYTTRIYSQIIALGGSYTINGYLAHFLPPEIPPTNTSYLFYIQVVEDYITEYTTTDIPVKDCSVDIKKYVSGTYQTVSILTTDAQGMVNLYLIPGSNYKVYCSKTGYTTSISDYIPSSPGVIKVFRIVKETPVAIPPCLDFWTTIVFNAAMNSTNVTHIQYYDTTGNTVDTQIYFYEFYNGVTTFLFSDLKTGNNSFYWNISGLNKTRTYLVVLYFNSSNDFCLFENTVSITIFPLNPWTNNPKFDVEERITDVFGEFKIGNDVYSWIGAIISILPLIILTLFDPANVGIGILTTGFFMAGIQIGIAVWTVNVPPPLIIVVTPVIILIGVLYMLSTRSGVSNL